MIDRAAMNEACRGLLKELGAPFGPEEKLSTMSVAEQQLVEIARALHRDARILVLDEPTTALSARETDRLFALIRQLRAKGLALIYISIVWMKSMSSPIVFLCCATVRMSAPLKNMNSLPDVSSV